MKKTLLFLITLLSTAGYSQTSGSFTVADVKITDLVSGNLFSPAKPLSKKPLVILIAGSGPTDRNGNQPGAENNSLKFLAESLAAKGIFVFSYDKRIIAQMAKGQINEAELSFTHLIDDAKSVISHFKSGKKYGKIIVAGHSEGSLIGMVAANQGADGFVSLAGAGRTIDHVILDQIIKQAPMLKEEVRQYLVLLKAGEKFELKNPMLASIFRESVQPYMISWISLDPAKEIAKLKTPVLIVNGTKDIQVAVSEATLLHQSQPKSRLEIIENMNHIFKTIDGPENENLESYSKPEMPINEKLTEIVFRFVKSV